MSDNRLKLHQLQPDVFSAEPMWEDFLTDLQDTIEEQIRAPIRQLENIRDVGPDSDAAVLSQTLVQLGITFPVDIIAHNLHRLRHSTHFLARLHETMGTESAYPAISYVMGRMLEVQNLWTKNYRDFYNRNYESLSIDGGSWYKTTHVDLGVEAVPQDIFMVLPEGVTRKDRILDAYFELAPVNQVVRRFYWILNLRADINLSGTIQIEPRKYITKGRGDWGITNVRVDGPDEVQSGQQLVPFFADLDFADTAGGGGGGGEVQTQVPRLPLYSLKPIGINTAAEVNQSLTTEFPDTNNRTLVVHNDGVNYGYLCYPIEMGYATFVEQGTGLEGGWDGASWPDDGDIGSSTGPIIITRTIGITTSQWFLYRMDFPAIGDFIFDVTFQNPGVVLYSTIVEIDPGNEDAYPGYTIPSIVDNWSTDRPDLVVIDDKGRISFGLVDIDTDVTVIVTAHGITSSKTVRIRAQERIDSIYIDAPETVVAGEQHEVKVFAVRNGVATLVKAEVRCIDPSITMEGNMMYVNGARETTKVELYTSYKGFKALAFVTVRFVSNTITLTGLRVQGVNQMNEEDSVQLICVASFSDGSERDVYPYWDISTPLLQAGELNTITAGSVFGDTDCTLTAVYQYRGTVMRFTHDMKVLTRNLQMVGLSISGPIEVSASTRTQYSAVARWSNGAASIVTGEWSVDRFDIDPQTGVLETGSIEDPMVLNIRCRSGGFQASMTVNAYAEPVQIQALRIIGPDNVKENVVGQFSALASYSDGTETYINPVWNLKGAAPGTTINADGQFVFSGDVPSGIIEVEAVYSVGGRTYRNTKPVVLIPEVAMINELFISGPTTVEEGERVQLVATVSYSDGRIETINPVWTSQSTDPINVPESAADVFDRGLVQGRRVDEDTTVVIVARYFKATASHSITVTPRILRSPDVPVSSRLIGPPVFTAGGVASYAQAIVFEACSDELLVSSDWSLDVDPSIAAIDANGYLYSVNGQALPVTVTAVYDCGTYTVTNSMVVNILPSQEDISSLIINGPDAVIENSTTPYTVELFRVGETPIPGQGETISNGVTWEILSGPSGAGVVVVDGIGSISVLTVPQDTQIVLKATYSEGFSTVSATKVIAVNKSVPVYGTASIGVRNDQMIRDSLVYALPSINSNQSFTIDIGIGKYGYFAYPAALGFARFIQSDNLVEGGWDGATWPDDGSIGTNTGPLTIARLQNGVITNWYLYRTDFASTGLRTWTVLFGN